MKNEKIFACNERTRKLLEEVERNGGCLVVSDRELVERFRLWQLRQNGEDSDERCMVAVQTLPAARAENDLLVFWPKADEGDNGRPWRIGDHAEQLGEALCGEIGADFDERCRRELDAGLTPVFEIPTAGQLPWIGPTQYRGDYNGNPSIALVRPGSKKGAIGWVRELVRMPAELTEAEVNDVTERVTEYGEGLIR